MSKTTVYICPVCKSKVEKDLREHLPISLHLRFLFITGFIYYLAYLYRGPELAWKCLFFYLPMWGIGEFIWSALLRQRVKCEFCSFDPLIYVSNWREARRLVEVRMQGRMDEITQGLGEQKKAHIEKMQKIKDLTQATHVPAKTPAKATAVKLDGKGRTPNVRP